jgi:hypothetical protein
MKDAVGNRTSNLSIRPGWMPIAKSSRQQLAHRAVHPKRLFQAPGRGHGPVNRRLAFMRRTSVIKLGGDGHAEKLADGVRPSRQIEPVGNPGSKDK